MIFFRLEQGFWKKKELNEIHQKVHFLIFSGELWQNSRPIFKTEIELVSDLILGETIHS